MNRLQLPTICTGWLVCFFLLSCGSGEPKVQLGLSINQLCNSPLSGVDERRCENFQACDSAVTNFCTTAPAGREQGYCRECQYNADCKDSECDLGWCRKSCTQDKSCDSGLYCTGGFCRPAAAFANFSFLNVGDRDLKIYPDKTTLHGDADANAFCTQMWSMGGHSIQTTTNPIVVPPNGTAVLRLLYRPETAGESRALVKVYSNDPSEEFHTLAICAQSFDNKCNVSFDSCPDCLSCTSADFTGYTEKAIVCQ
jgi:hypothetical protein